MAERTESNVATLHGDQIWVEVRISVGLVRLKMILGFDAGLDRAEQSLKMTVEP